MWSLKTEITQVCVCTCMCTCMHVYVCVCKMCGCGHTNHGSTCVEVSQPLGVAPCLSTFLRWVLCHQTHCPVSFRRFFLYPASLLPAGTSWDHRHLCSASGSYVIPRLCNKVMWFGWPVLLPMIFPIGEDAGRRCGAGN